MVLKEFENENFQKQDFQKKSFENYAKSLGIFKIAYTKIDSELQENEIDHENVIILAIEMDNDIIDAELGEKAKILNKEFYEKFRKITEKIAEYLNNQGFKTQIAFPNEILVDLAILGEKAGIGCIAKSGLLITPEFGSKIKLSGILTSLNDSSFNSNQNNHKWIENYCKDCDECLDYCESQALIKESEKTVKFIDSECIGSEKGCTFCIEMCPFNKKDYHLIKEEFFNKD